VVITGIQGGTFSLILLGSVVTDSLTTTSTGQDIATALSAAASSLPSTVRECSSFSVSTSLLQNGQNLYIRILFNVDNAVPLTLIDAFVGNVVGKLLNYIAMV
jgi:hypothetical protein